MQNELRPRLLQTGHGLGVENLAVDVPRYSIRLDAEQVQMAVRYVARRGHLSVAVAAAWAEANCFGQAAPR